MTRATTTMGARGQQCVAVLTAGSLRHDHHASWAATHVLVLLYMLQGECCSHIWGGEGGRHVHVHACHCKMYAGCCLLLLLCQLRMQQRLLCLKRLQLRNCCQLAAVSAIAAGKATTGISTWEGKAPKRRCSKTTSSCRHAAISAASQACRETVRACETATATSSRPGCCCSTTAAAAAISRQPAASAARGRTAGAWDGYAAAAAAEATTTTTVALLA